ncbi:uncharacterized protein LOC128269899 [Anopheles cruzii]|uniref:uncharacterized protein LOC128269899 n=1 Tax=Anopheles cruzii TaxID=68878 RepID=UPI0022EC921A|nr:uncharacterized protein LOC128269899 [Anopheles cruzii]
MDADSSFLPDKLDMDPDMTDRLQQQQHQQQHIVVLDEGASSSYSRVSPPKAVIDSSPLQSAMDKNKESLKVKLLVRRSFDQLVQQGIMPPLKTSPAIYEQRRQLERAKTGDLLKAKIKKRPDRVELEQRHILEHCDSHIDPSLAEKRRMLEKALLVDHLNSKISHRPGPLDLIGKNILHADEPIERIVKEGLVDYTSTLDDASVPTPTTVGEGEDSLSSEGESLQGVAVALVASQHEQQVALLPHAATIQLPAVVGPSPATLPATQILTVPTDHFIQLEPGIPIMGNDGTLLATIATQLVTPTTTVATVAAVPLAAQGAKEKSRVPAVALRSILPSAKPAGEVPLTLSMTVAPSIAADLKHHLSSSSNGVSSSTTTGGCSAGPGTSIGIGGGKDKSSKKKCKSKTITKARSIKFHEYKGPSGSHKSSSGSGGGGGGSLSSDNNYQLIMKQQHLLEYLEEMCKKPTGIPSPSSSSSNRDQIATDGEADTAGTGADLTPIDSPLGSQSGAATPARNKTSTGGTGGATAGTDLSMDALNKYKVSQLKKYCKQYNLPVSGTKSNLIERLRAFVKTADLPGGLLHIVSPTPVADTGGESLELEDNLLAEQQKRIAELQLQLKRSQEELEQFRSMCTNQFAAPGALDAGPVVPIPPPPPPPPPQCPLGSAPNRHHLGDVLVARSPFSIAADSPIGEDGGGSIADSTGTADPGPGPVVSRVLEAGFFLGGLSTADSTTVDYGHEMEDIMHAELTATTAAPTVPSAAHSVERSPTHHAMLDKVLGQVQPTISGLTMPDPVVEDRGLVAPQVGGVVSVVPPIGDMHDLSLSMKSVKFEAPPDTGDDSMQQDAIMLNDFGDIDLVDFQMHSLDSDGPFPMITNHDPMPVTSSTTEHHHQHMQHHHHHHHQQHASPSSTATHGTLSLFGVQNDPSGIKLLSNSFPDHLHSSDGPGVVDVLQPHQTYINNNDILSIADDSDALGLLEQDDRQIGLTAPTSMKLFHQHPHLQHQHHHHQREQQQQLHQQQSDSNNNRNNSFGANSSIGSFRFALQQQQPIASSSSSSASSSPGNCFKSPAVPGQQLTANNANLSKPQTTLILTPTNHDHQHQQQLHPNHHPHQQQLLQQQQSHDQLGQISAASGSSNGTLMGEDIESFQDNAMDFESLLTNDEAEADGVLTANTCHRMMLDCAQDKPMFSFLPETSILDYFNEDCNGHDYELKHLEY